jgi:signal transduction histidine kinase
LSSIMTRRSWMIDALVFLLGLGFIAITVVDGLQRRVAPVLVAVDAALGGLAALGLWVRRRWPVGVAAVAGLVSLYSASASGIALIAVFTVAVHRPAKVAGLVGAGCALAAVASVLIPPEMERQAWSQVALNLACVAAALAWGMVVRARRQLVWSRTEQATLEQELRVTEARRLERARLAREMHDVLAHRLSLLSLQAGALELRTDAAPAEVARAAGLIRDSAHRALEDLRDVLGVLRGDGADDGPADSAPEPPQPGLADLPTLLDEARQAGLPVIMDGRSIELTAAPEATGRTAYRIVQEGLTNARKHAPGAAVTVTVDGTAGHGLTTEVRNPHAVDEGEVDPIPGAGTGLVGLAERVALVGGQLEHGRTPDGGFRLWAWLPWPT